MANQAIADLISLKLTKGADPDRITGLELRDTLNAINAYIQDEIAFTTAIPFTRMVTVIAPQTITVATVFTKNVTGAVKGAGAILRLVSDGVTIPDFSAFQCSGDAEWLNSPGAVNLVVFLFDGIQYWYEIKHAGIPTENKIAEWDCEKGVSVGASGVLSWDELNGDPLYQWKAPATFEPPAYNNVTGVDFGNDGMAAMELDTPIPLIASTVYVKALTNAYNSAMLGDSAVGGYMLFCNNANVQLGPNAAKAGGPWFIELLGKTFGPLSKPQSYAFQWDGQRDGYVAYWKDGVKEFSRAAGFSTPTSNNNYLNPVSAVGWNLRSMQGEALPDGGALSLVLFKGRMYRIIVYGVVHDDATVQQILAQL